uniref:Uncharacterized protein n=1 Tax=Lactuca sativa TaxID=4236 RepID=A0A9R1V8D1_LACSA|nr:hypothetical protein LSAT_V11C600339260 [Lactuca sativa]
MVVQVSKSTSSSYDSNNTKSPPRKIPTPHPTKKDKTLPQSPQKTPPQSSQKIKPPTPPTSPNKPSPVKETDMEPSMSNGNFHDSPKTMKKKTNWRETKIKSYKYPNIKEANLRAANFLYALVCDLGRNDVEIHSVLAEKMKFPPFEIPE